MLRSQSSTTFHGTDSMPSPRIMAETRSSRDMRKPFGEAFAIPPGVSPVRVHDLGASIKVRQPSHRSVRLTGGVEYDPDMQSALLHSTSSLTWSEDPKTPRTWARESDQIVPEQPWALQPGAHTFSMKRPGSRSAIFVAPTARSPDRISQSRGYNPANFDEGIFFPKGDNGKGPEGVGPPRLYDGDAWVGARHSTNSAKLFEAGSAPQNKLRVFKSRSNPYLLYQMNANHFPTSRYWR